MTNAFPAACPYCGHSTKIQPGDGAGCCRNCRLPYRATLSTVHWAVEALQQSSLHSLPTRSLHAKLRDAVNSGLLWERTLKKLSICLKRASLYNILTQGLRKKAARIMEEYYSAIISAGPISVLWGKMYLPGIELKAGSTALDFGCGRGEKACHLSNIGFKVYGQDIYRDPWWEKLPFINFAVAPSSMNFLPWETASFDLIVVCQVQKFFDNESWRRHVHEFHRVLKPSGAIVMFEANPGSRAIRDHKKYYGRDLHSLVDAKAMYDFGFTEIDSWHEKYYAEWFPHTDKLVQFCRHSGPGEWMLHDERSSALPPEKRGIWVLRMRKKQI